MLKNYLLIALRNIKRHKGYSFLNISGLAIGIASCLFILLYVQFELSYDSYHNEAENIYRVANSRKTDLQTELFATAPLGAAPTLKQEFPEVIEAARCGEASNYQVKYKDKQFIEENTGYADNELFKILNIPIIYGNPETILIRPKTVVITREISEKYFGQINPVGEILMLDTTAYVVDGVIENFPTNTHLKKDFFLCFHTANEIMEHYGMTNPWGGFNCMNYVKLAKKTDAQEFENKIKFLPHTYNGDALKKQGVEATLFLQSIQDIHLYSNLNWEAEPPGNLTYLIVFSSVGILILILACMNYMNLMTARSTGRSEEVGVRKVVGANRSQLVFQFIGESFITTLISVLFSILIVVLLLPYFNALTGLEFSSNQLTNSKNFIGIIIIMVFIAIAAGSYPAFLLSSFKPVSILKKTASKGNRGILMRKLLVISQFAISIILIIGLLLYQQVDYMKNQYLGFDKEQKLVIEFDRSIITPESYETVKSEFLKHPAVSSATISSSVPGRWMYFWHLHPFGDDENDQMINCFQIDYDFINDYNLEIVAGRAFSRNRGIDNNDGGWIINEATVKAFGWNSNNDALNQAINRESAKVIGVAKNFHLKGLQNKIEPLAMFFMHEDFRYLTLQVNVEKANEVIAFVKEKHAFLFPGYLFDYFFLDEDFDKQYQSEETMISLFGIFAALGIIIAVLGLFGLAAYLAEKRTKEIGIRKVLGANIPTIVYMLTKEFVKWVILANVIAWPVSYFLMNKILEDFAYRIDVGIVPFALSAVLAIMISVITVSFQTVKAALANPVDSLKYE